MRTRSAACMWRHVPECLTDWLSYTTPRPNSVAWIPPTGCLTNQTHYTYTAIAGSSPTRGRPTSARTSWTKKGSTHP